ncbi:MAG TPA: cell envelope integrity protein TolA [Candidatus Tumulicola sp.]|jgi:hypothetical protein
MISGRRDDRERGPLLWAFVASILLHALLVPFYGWTWIVRLAPPKPMQNEMVVASTAIRIERRAIPVPRAISADRAARATRASQAQRAVQPVRPAPESAMSRHELARQLPQATPQPEPTADHPDGHPAQPEQATLQQQLASQEQRFARQAEQFRSQNNPLSLAPPKHQIAEAFHRSYFDVPGHVQKQAVQIQLIPLRHWYSGTTICYYARYVAQFSSGAGEDGTIPWPVCYPVDDDRIANPPYVHDVPLPLPPIGFVLPPGTYLTPLMARIYSGREGSR